MDRNVVTGVHLVPPVGPQPQVSAVHLLGEEQDHLEEGGPALFHTLHKVDIDDIFLVLSSLS